MLRCCPTALPAQLLLLLLPALIAQAANVCDGVGAAHVAALAACGTSDLRELFRSDRLDRGSPLFCGQTCIDAVATLQTAAAFCQDMDVLLGYSNAKSEVARVYEEQLQCFPPNAGCVVVQRDLDRYLASSVGAACLAQAASIETSTNATARQITAKAMCSSCNAGFQAYLTRFVTAGCTGWNAFKFQKMRFEQYCLAVDGTYCAASLPPSRIEELEDTARDSNLLTTARDASLAALCTPCFFKQLELHAKYALDTSTLNRLEPLCIKDESRFCFPRYQNALVANQGVGLNDEAKNLCEDGVMGRCAAKMLARAAQRDSPSATELQKMNVQIEQMCLRSEAGELCAVVMDPVVAGFNDNGVYQGAKFTGPDTSECDAISTGDFCTWGCQRKYTENVNSFGCCVDTTRAYLKNIGATDVDSAFEHVDTLSTECARPTDDSCATAAATTSMSIPVPVPIGFLATNGTVLPLLLQDVLVLLGRTADSISLISLTQSEDDPDETILAVTVTGQDTDDTGKVATALTSDIQSGAAVPYLTVRHYESRCQPEGAGTACGEAAAAPDESVSLQSSSDKVPSNGLSTASIVVLAVLGVLCLAAFAYLLSRR